MGITYGIEDDIFLPLPAEKRNQVRAANGADPSAIILWFVGLIVQRKGFEFKFMNCNIPVIVSRIQGITDLANID